MRPPERRRTTPKVPPPPDPLQASDRPAPGVRRPAKLAGAVSVSLFAHAGLLLAFAAIRWGVLADPVTDPVVAGFADEQVVETLVTLPKVAHETTPTAGSMSAAPVLSEPLSQPLDVTSVTPDKAVTPAEDTTTKPEAKTVARASTRGQGDGNAVGNGSGEGGSFFDLASAGNRIVYVVDCSKSMKRRFPSPERTRFARVKRELVESIGSLREEQRFFVIYFNTEAHPMPGTRLVSRSSYNLNQYLTWLASFPPDGRTNPEDALLMALRLKPDAIFFLTDGAFRPNIVDNVIAANASGIPINAIGFGDEVLADDEEALAVLESLAERTGGQLTLISDSGNITRR